jgi:uncharacterized membrane protein HdeD (DUF308 family)
VFISTLALGMAVGAGYEVVEWVSDSLLGTAFVEDADDTGRDLLADTLGSLAGATFLTVWSLSHWSSRRSTYRAAPLPPFRTWLRGGRALLQRGRARLEGRRGPVASLSLGLAGLCTVAFGVLVLAWPRLTVGTLVLLFGIYAVGYGILKLVVGSTAARRPIGGPLLLDALGTLAAGIVVLAWPRISAAVLFYVIALAMILAGLAGVALASVLPVEARERTLLGAAAVTSVVVGVVVLAWPGDAVSALRWLVGAQALVLGVVLLVAALRVRDRPAAKQAAPRPTG